jgi:DNA-binding MarR family transcriptional regulator
VPGPELDRLIHEPARLRLVTLLYVVDEADFTYLADRTGMTAGNISSHMAKLEGAGYVDVAKSFVGRRPHTVYRLTAGGRRAVETYRREIAALLAGMDAAGAP